MWRDLQETQPPCLPKIVPCGPIRTCFHDYSLCSLFYKMKKQIRVRISILADSKLTISAEEQSPGFQAAIARTATRGIALYFSRPVRLFRPSKSQCTCSSSSYSEPTISSQRLAVLEKSGRAPRCYLWSQVSTVSNQTPRCRSAFEDGVNPSWTLVQV